MDRDQMLDLRISSAEWPALAVYRNLVVSTFGAPARCARLRLPRGPAVLTASAAVVVTALLRAEVEPARSQVHGQLRSSRTSCIATRCLATPFDRRPLGRASTLSHPERVGARWRASRCDGRRTEAQGPPSRCGRRAGLPRCDERRADRGRHRNHRTRTCLHLER